MEDTLLEEPFETIPGISPGASSNQPGMKLVWCVIRPESLEAVKEALNTLQAVGGMTITDVRGFGRQRGQVEHYRGGEYQIRFLPKVRVEVAVRDEDLERVMAAISKAARTGQVGDGKLFILEVTSALRIRTGERGASAL